MISDLLTLFILHCLAVMDDVRPSYQTRSVKVTSITSIGSNHFLSNALHPNQDPALITINIPLVNNRKGSLLPAGPGPGLGVGQGPALGLVPDPSQLRFSISVPGEVMARSAAESRLSRARSLPAKYHYQPSSAMLLGHSRHCRWRR